MASSPKGIIRTWRIEPENSDPDRQPFSGEGPKYAGGRWNHKGTRIIYVASSISLAMLEILAHLRGPRKNFHYLAYWLDIPEGPYIDSSFEGHHQDFFETFNRDVTRDIGSSWAASQKSLALKVPSIVNPHEFNYLVNPSHPEFKKHIKHATKRQAKRLELDPRLIKTA